MLLNLRCPLATWAVGLQGFGTEDDMQHLLELPTFNTLAIANTMKAAIRKSDPAAHWHVSRCCKLVLLAAVPRCRGVSRHRIDTGGHKCGISRGTQSGL